MPKSSTKKKQSKTQSGDFGWQALIIQDVRKLIKKGKDPISNKKLSKETIQRLKQRIKDLQK